MSFLSRKNSQPDKRGGRAADRRRADSEYDDYGYAPDAHQDDDDAWSPDEYFSPEGIKGRWAAGARPGERSGVSGHGDDGYDDQGAGPQRARGAAAGGSRGGYQPGGYPRDGYGPDGYGQDGSSGNDDFKAGPDYGTGGYDRTEDDGGDRAERGGGRRRRERGGGRGERRLRLGRRDRSPDIWPDDEVSDEDYWASVSADRPFHSANDALDADPSQAAAGRPMGRPPGAARPGGASESRLTADRPLGADRGPGGKRSLAGDPRVAGEPRVASEQRTGSGRLGPPPGLSPAASAALSGQNGYLPGGTAPGRPAPADTSRANSGPMPRSSSGPMARSSSGPMARSSSGPMARSSSGPMARSSSGPMPRSAGGAALAPAAPQMYSAPPALPAHAAPPARPAAGLAQPTFQPNGARAASRPSERPDWGDRTERIERVTATGYPEPRHGARPQDPRGQDGRGALEGQGVWSQDATNHDARNQGRPRRGADDDPLTSKAWSRSALVDTDGRSYRVAARRAQVPDDRREAALNEQTQTFGMPQYPADPQAGTARNPGHGAQHSGQYPYDRRDRPVPPVSEPALPVQARQRPGRRQVPDPAPGRPGQQRLRHGRIRHRRLPRPPLARRGPPCAAHSPAAGILEGCPKVTSSGTPHGACTRRWRGGC